MTGPSVRDVGLTVASHARLWTRLAGDGRPRLTKEEKE